ASHAAVEACSSHPALSSRGALGRKCVRDGVERRLTLKSDAWPVGKREVASIQLRVVRKPAEGAEYAGARFRPTKSEPGCDGERHLIAAVREQGAARPAMALEHSDRACVLHDAVSLRRIDLDHIVALRLQAAEAHQVFYILRRKKIFASRKGRRIAACDFRKQGKIERIARLFEPAQPEWRQRLRVGECLVAAEF